MLSVCNLTKSFLKPISLRPLCVSKKARLNLVLNNISFSVSRGEAVSFLGANGSGKSTTFKCLLGLLRFDQGRVRFFDHQPLCLSVLREVGFLPEQPRFYPYLTGEEQLLFYGRLSRPHQNQAELMSRAGLLLKKLGLYSVKNQKIKTYSKGMVKKLGLALAFLHRPKLALLDEPFAGLDPLARAAAAALIQSQTQQGAAVLLSSHLLEPAEQTCQKVLVLKGAKIIYKGLLTKMPAFKEPML